MKTRGAMLGYALLPELAALSCPGAVAPAPRFHGAASGSSDDGGAGKGSTPAASDTAASDVSAQPESEWASTSVTTADGKLTLTGRSDSVIHTHGGPPVQVIKASFDVSNRGTTARTLSARKIELLWNEAKSMEPPTVLLQSLTSRGLAGMDVSGAAVAPSSTLMVGAGSTLRVNVYFEPIHLSHDFGKRQAFRVEFDVDGESLTALAEIAVSRVEPGAALK